MNRRVVVVVMSAMICLGCQTTDPYWGVNGPIHTHELPFQKKDRGDTSIPIDQFVRQVFTDRVPVGEIRKYQRETAIKVLSPLLKKKDCGSEADDGPVCSNSVTALGVIGGDEARKAILDFLKRGEVSDFRAKTSALIALGYWVNTTETEKDQGNVNAVIDSLQSCIGTTNKGFEKFQREYKSSQEEGCPVALPAPGKQERRIRRAAILALALSGSTTVKKVRDTLEIKLKEAPVGSSFRAFIIEALRSHKRIARIGLVCFYEPKDQEMSKECKDRWTGKPFIDIR